jgi:hypothetical protein
MKFQQKWPLAHLRFGHARAASKPANCIWSEHVCGVRNAPGRGRFKQDVHLLRLAFAESTSSLSHRHGIAGLVIGNICLTPRRMSRPT